MAEARDGPRARVPVALCFDVEPDRNLSPPGQPSPWLGFERLVQMVPELRHRLSSATGQPARFSWFLRLDPEIAHTYGSHQFVFDRYGPALDALVGEGDTVGAHTHMGRWVGDRWLLDHANAGWVEECLSTSLATFLGAMGERARIHRFGDNWVDGAALSVLDSLGVTCDLSVLPGCRLEPPPGVECTGVYPEMGTAPQRPYRPEGLGLWEIPLSTTGEQRPRPRLARLRRRARHPVMTASNGLSRLRGSRPPPDQPVAPSWSLIDPVAYWRSGAQFWDAAQRHVAQLDQPYLAFAVRSHLPINRQRLANFRRVFNHLGATSVAGRLQFTTAEDALHRLVDAGEDLNGVPPARTPDQGLRARKAKPKTS